MDKLTKMLNSMKGENGKVKWYWYLVAVLVFLVALFFASSLLKRNRDELAKLRHERNKKAILEANERTAVLMAKNEKAAEEALQRAERAAKQIGMIDANIKRVKERAAGDRAAVERLTWADLPRAEDG